MNCNVVIIIAVIACCCRYGQSFNISFTTQPREQVSLESFNAAFTCRATAAPAKVITYLWKLNGKFINTNIDRRIIIASDGGLTISGVVTSDFGVYQCVAQCSDGSIISLPAKLEKADFRVTSVPSKVKYSQKEGTFFYLNAPKYESKPAAKFEWKICRRGSCQFDRSRVFITAKGDLLIPALLKTDSGYTFSYVISPKFHHPQTFPIGEIIVTGRLFPPFCPDATVEFLPSQKNFTVNEGENVSLDCLAVFKRCRTPLQVEWRKCDYCDPISQVSSRGLEIKSIKKSDEGVYKCFALTNGGPNASYYVHVIEKPKLVREPPSVYLLAPNGLVPCGSVRGANFIEWYTNAEKITGDSNYYEVLANNSLRISFFSESLAGIYQIFYYNKAGVISRNVRVDINNNICRGKLTSEAGEIAFLHPRGLPNALTQCVWLIQTPASRYIKLNFTKFDFNKHNSDCNTTKLSAYEGTITSNVSNKHEFCYSKRPTKEIIMAGPYITVSLVAYGNRLRNAGFTLVYGYKNTVSTSRPTTKGKPSTTSSTSRRSSSTSIRSSSKISTSGTSASKTTAGTTARSTRSTTSFTTRATSKKSSKFRTNASTKANFPFTTDHTKVATTKSSTKESKDKLTTHASRQAQRKSEPLRMRNSCPTATKVLQEQSSINVGGYQKDIANATLLAQEGTLCIFIVAVGVVFVGEQRRDAYYRNDPSSTGVTFAAIGGAAGVIMIIIIVIAIVCYRRKRSKAPVKSSIPKEMAIIGSRGSFNNYSSETYKRRSTTKAPILNYDGIHSSTSETCFTLKDKGKSPKSQFPDVIPSRDSPRYEMGFLGPGTNATREENYTYISNDTVKGELGAKNGKNCKNKTISRLKEEPNYAILEPGETDQYQALMSSSLSSDSSATRSNNSLPVYAAAGYSSPLYHSLESEDRVVSQYANKQEPTYQVLEDEKDHVPLYNVLNVPSSSETLNSPSSGSFDPSADYLRPMQPPNEGCNARQGSQFVSMEPVYHVLKEGNDNQPIYASTEYIEPNPVIESHKSVVRRTSRIDSSHGICPTTTASTEDTYQPLASNLADGNNGPIFDNIYQPIISDDASYMPIIPSESSGETSSARNVSEDIYNPTYQPLGVAASDEIYQPLS